MRGLFAEPADDMGLAGMGTEWSDFSGRDAHGRTDTLVGGICRESRNPARNSRHPQLTRCRRMASLAATASTTDPTEMQRPQRTHRLFAVARQCA